MRRLRRVVRWTIYGTMAVLAVLAAVYYAVAHTDPGIERAASSVLDRVRTAVNGELYVDDVTSSGLLAGATLHGVRLIDPAGRTFARLDSVRLGYSIFQLVRGRIVFDEVGLFGGEAVVERLPGEPWNYEVVLGLGGDGDGSGGPPRLIALENVTVDGTDVTVRMPWTAAENPEADTTRLLLAEVPGGTVREYRFRDVVGELPSITLQSPDRRGIQVLVQGLATRAFIYADPVQVRNLVGGVEVVDSVVSFGARRLALAGSRTAARGRIVLGRPNRYDIQFVGADVAFADLRWLIPRLPATGRAQLDFLIRTQASADVMLEARNARVRTGSSDVRGAFGMITGRPLRLVDVDVDARSLELDLVQRLAQRELPVDGRLEGTFQADGPLTALRSRGDLRLFRSGREQVDVRWSGTAGLAGPFAARELEAELRRVELDVVAAMVPRLELRGMVEGTVRLDGDLDAGLAVDGRLRHAAATGESSLAFGGTVVHDDSVPWLDVRLDAEPVRLETVAVQVPAAERMTGPVGGTVRARGRWNDLDVEAELETPAGGVEFRGRLDRTARPVRYRAEGRLDGFQVDRVLEGVPATRLSTRFVLDASGFELAGLDGTLALDVSEARVREVGVQAANARLRFGDGLARVDTFALVSDVGRLEARGTFGLARDVAGAAELDVQADSLRALESFFFPDTALVMDPGAVSAALDGSVGVRATVEGSLHAFDARGTAELRGARYDEIAVDSGSIRFDVTGVGTDSIVLRGRAAGRAVRLFGRVFETAEADGRYQAPGDGRLHVVAAAPGGEHGIFASSFRVRDGTVAFGLDTLELHTRGRSWRLDQPVEGRFGDDGLRLDELELARADGPGRLRLSGTLPWRERLEPGRAASRPASFVVEADSFRVADFLRLAQADTVLDGFVGARIRVAGTAGAPTIEGRLRVDSLRYGGAALDSVAATLDYADRRFGARLEGWRRGARVVEGEAEVPVDLTLGDVEERRPERPLDVRLRAMDLPAGVPLALVPGFREVAGRVNGLLQVSGTTRSPTLRGRMELEDGSAVFDALGVRYRRIQARGEMTGTGVLTVSGRLETEGGGADVDGTVTFEPPNDPRFALSVTARRFQASNRQDFRSFASGDVRLSGRYTRPVVTGALQLNTGELNIDEIWRRSQIVQLESPALFEVVDTSLVSMRQALPRGTSPFLQNIRVDSLELAVGSDVWLRSRQLNVAVTGRLTLNFDRQTEDIAMTGTLQAVRGTYVLQPGAERFAAPTEFLQRRFDIRSGTIEFAGTPGINPNLDVSAAYRVNLRQQDPLTITATVTGTLQTPRVQLTSDAQPAISETDLLSYLYFGQPSFQLGQSQTELLSGLLLNTLGSGLQNVFASAGILDYFGISVPSAGGRAVPTRQQFYGGTLAGTLVEAGTYIGRDLFLAGSYRLPGAQRGGWLTGNQLGLRIEWQIQPRLTAEAFWENRFLRQPAIGLFTFSEQRPVVGLSLFHEWGY